MQDSPLKKILTWSFPRAEKDTPEYSGTERNMFALGMFGQNLIYTIVGSYLSVFYTDVIFVPTLALLLVTIISRIWDALNDLLMGTIVDKTHSRWGKCRPYLKYAPIPIAIFTALMFAPVKSLASFPKVVFVIITWLSWEALYTLGDIPLWGMTSLMTDNVEKRTKLVSLARIIGGISVVVGMAFEPIMNFFASMDLGWFPQVAEKEGFTYFSYQQGYFLAVAALSLIGLIFFKLPFIFTRERVKPAEDVESLSFKESFKLFLSNHFFLRTVVSNILGCGRNLILSVIIYYCTWVLANGGNYTIWYILLLAPFLIGNLGAMATSNFFEQKIGKIRLMKLVSFLSVIPFTIMFLAMTLLGTSPAAIVIVCICQLFNGLGSGFSSVYFTTMITDSIDYMEWKTGKRYDGVYLSGLNFISKFSNAVTLAITYITFFIIRYSDRIEALKDMINAGKTGLNFSAEYPDITFALILLLTIVPLVSSVLQGLPLLSYKLDNKKHSEIVAELVQRRANAEKKDN